MKRFLAMSLLFMAGTSSVGAGIVVVWPESPLVAYEGGIGTPPNQSIDLNGDEVIDFTFMTSVTFVLMQTEGENQCVVYPPAVPPDTIVMPDVSPLDSNCEIGETLAHELGWYGNEIYPSLLAFWTMIPLDFANTMDSDGPPLQGGSFLGTRAYIGVAFYASDGLHYGWLDVEVGSGSRYAAIYGWGYEDDPGVSILAGAGSPLAVPEPGTLALLGLGGIALIFRRNRRQT